MRIIILSSVAALALATAACGGTDEPVANDVAVETLDNGTDNAMAMNDAAAMPTDATSFANAAAATDLYEVESAKLAEQKGVSKEVKEVAGHIRTDHEKSTADLKTAAAAAKLTVTPALDAEKQAMLDELKAATGADFDAKFLTQQKTAHEKALTLLQTYASGGDNPALKEFAGKAAGVVKGHLDHLGTIKQ